MCGIAGFTQFGHSYDNPGKLLESMGNTIAHRGPDDSDVYTADEVGLCHRRLAIIDLTESGRQPMNSMSGRFVTVFNGEIYNFQALRASLEEDGMSFRGSSDTEVMLALYEKHGPDCLKYLNGMFAIAIWDTVEKTLFLARDRLGKKPLYYYRKDKQFVFASEIKAILATPDTDRTIRQDAVQDFFFYQYVPESKSIFKFIDKVQAGHWMLVSKDGVKSEQYWNVSFASTSDKSADQIQDELYDLLDDSVKSRMVSDVPLGAFLSGGVDSSAVVGLMAKNSATPVTTCAIGFDSEKFDEVAYAARVAEQFKTDHHELTVKETVADNLTDIAGYFDEPFADPSFVPTYFVSKLARTMVTVALAGDGGDENFAGYEKYLQDQLENKLRSLVPSIVPASLFGRGSRMLFDRDNRHLRRGASLLSSLSATADTGFFISNTFFSQQLWDRLVRDDFRSKLSGYNPADITTDLYNSADTDNHLSKVLYTDIKSYLPGDILVKVDRMSMANSLETRAPILDYRVVEYAATIPASLKLHDKESKYILKKTMERLLTDETLYRKKMGFSVPLANWLRNEINHIAESRLLAPNNGISQFFKPDEIKKVWQQHQSGARDYSSELWSMLTFELWWERYMTQETV